MRSQKGEVPPGAETAEIEGWEPFPWKHNALPALRARGSEAEGGGAISGG